MLFALWHNSVYEEFFSGGILHTHYRENWREISTHNGFFHYFITKPLPSCEAVPRQQAVQIVQHSYLDHFRSRYASLGFNTAVFFTPVADCNPNLAMYRQVLGASAINKPFSLPRSYMADDYQANHPLAEGTVRVSEIFADLIKGALAPLSSAR
jgi:hypothetical protein